MTHATQHPKRKNETMTTTRKTRAYQVNVGTQTFATYEDSIFTAILRGARHFNSKIKSAPKCTTADGRELSRSITAELTVRTADGDHTMTVEEMPHDPNCSYPAPCTTREYATLIK